MCKPQRDGRNSKLVHSVIEYFDINYAEKKLVKLTNTRKIYDVKDSSFGIPNSDWKIKKFSKTAAIVSPSIL